MSSSRTVAALDEQPSERQRTVEKLRARVAAMEDKAAGEPVPTLPGLTDIVPMHAGSTYAVDSASLALALAAGASRAGEWVGFAGCPDFGAEAAAELGVELSRTVLVPDPGEHWLEVTAALVDVLRVVVRGHDEASSAAEGEPIDAEGELTLPLIGTVRVGGLSLDQARAELARRYSVYIDAPKVALSVVARGTREFYVLGHVERPGPVALSGPLNALQALSFGGSFLMGARRDEVLLIRRAGDRYDVHVFDASKPGRDGLIDVQPGDLIFVRGY